MTRELRGAARSMGDLIGYARLSNARSKRRSSARRAPGRRLQSRVCRSRRGALAERPVPDPGGLLARRVTFVHRSRLDRPIGVTEMNKTVTEAANVTPEASGSPARSRRHPPEVLTEAEAIALIKACSASAPTGIRNRALIAVLWRCGLRISEALALELRDIDLEAGTIRVRHGKGDKSRTVGSTSRPRRCSPAGSTAGGASPPAPARRSSARCTAVRSTPATSATCYPASRAKPGSTGRVHAHGLRHTYAAELARERTPINVIRDALGHTTLAVTDRYLRDVAPMHVIDTMRARAWGLSLRRYRQRRPGLDESPRATATALERPCRQ